MKLIRTPSMAWALMTALALPVASVQAQSASGAPHAAHAPLNQVLHLTASAQTEVAQDWLVITLSVQKEGLQAPAVQKQLNAILSSALAVATPMAKPGALEVKTGDMNVSPRYGREGKMNGWVGSAQLVLQGRDVEQITTLAGRMPDLTVSQIDWRLSPEQKKEAESRIQAEAVAQLPHLKLRGLMCIPEPADGFEAQRAVFLQAKALFDHLNAQGLGLDTLSMGMSDDLDAAVAAGSTMVRVGRAIFGSRAARA